jgi:putative phosphoribosyl transferase
MFRDREDAGRQLSTRLKERQFRQPLVLAIPRGGIVVGGILAQELGADLDVILARKLRAPYQPELAIGAISESGEAYLNPQTEELVESLDEYLEEERRYQLAEIKRRQRLFRSVRPPASIRGRSVIVTDDGIATGSTMMAGLRVVRAQEPFELMVAVPVATPNRLEQVRRLCDEMVCLDSPETFWAIGQFYEDFSQIDDEEALAILRRFASSPHQFQPARNSTP